MEARVDEIRAGGFRVCFNQGINVRMVDDASAKALASIRYTDDSFTRRRLYTAWDSLGDEERFFDGVAALERYGVPASHVMAYMLVGYDRRETWERVLYRFKTMAALGIRPFPMVYGDRRRKLPLGGASQRLAHRTLGGFQRWAVRRANVVAPFEECEGCSIVLLTAGPPCADFAPHWAVARTAPSRDSFAAESISIARFEVFAPRL